MRSKFYLLKFDYLIAIRDFKSSNISLKLNKNKFEIKITCISSSSNRSNLGLGKKLILNNFSAYLLNIDLIFNYKFKTDEF